MLRKFNWLISVVLAATLMFSVQISVFAAEEVTVANATELQTELDAASPGDTIYLGAGTYYVSEMTYGYLLIDKDDITIKGEEGTNTSDIIIKGGTASYIIRTKAAGITLEGFTIDADTSESYFRQYAIKCETPDELLESGTALDGNITIQNIDILDSMHSAIDINGVNNVTINNVTVGGLQKGVGVNLTNCSAITVAECNFTNIGDLAWGNIALGTSDLYDKTVSDIYIEDCVYNVNKVSVYYDLSASINEPGTIKLDTISIEGLSYAVPSSDSLQGGSFYAKLEDAVSAAETAGTYVFNTTDKKITAVPGGMQTAPTSPTANPAAGRFSSRVSVTLSSDYASAIYYTTDGSEPTLGSNLYKTSFSISSTTTVKAIAVMDIEGVIILSETASFTYTKTSSDDEDDSSSSGSSSKNSDSTTTTTQPEVVDTQQQPISTTDLQADPYLAGYSDGTIKPDGSLTRAELAQLVFNLYSDESSVFTDASYLDISGEHWAYDAISFATSAGYMTGYTDGTFAPDKAITRAEFVTVFAKIKGLTDKGEVKFTDVTGHWAEEYILAMIAKGAINGYEDETFRPDRTITRAETCVIISNLEGRLQQFNAQRSFTDLSEDYWAYSYMMNAANGFSN